MVLGTSLGNYRVVEQLGQGSMGVVYVGQHEALGRRVVVKVLRTELSSHAEMVRRFFNEAQAATAIRNPGIVQVFDFGMTSDGRAYFVMELLEGEPLASRLKQRRHGHEECCRLGRQVANVLQAAHAVGITHRDLKPDHLFLVPDAEVAGGERVKVLDFGIAKLAGEAKFGGVKTRTGMIMGSPHYMSPEQCRSANAADPRSDIYSLGCILFEIACGRRPFVFEGIGDLVAAHLHEHPPHPQQLAPDMPAGLAALIAKMLAKLPNARPQTMAVVSQTLDEVMHVLGGSSARPPTPPRRSRPPSHAHPPPRRPAQPPAATPPTHAPLPPPPTHAPPPPPAPGVSSIATTLRRQVRRSRVWLTVGSPRWPFVIGALVIASAVLAIAIVLSTDHATSPARVVSYADIATAPHAATRVAPADAGVAHTDVAVASADAAVASVDAAVASADAAAAVTIGDAAGDSSTAPHSPPVTVPVAPNTNPATTMADDLAAVCRKLQADRKWQELEKCADHLMPLDPKRTAEFKTRAVEETRSAPHIAGGEAALRNKDLKQARAELDQVWTKSVDYTSVKRDYDSAEAQAIDELAAQLAPVKAPGCEAYNQFLAKQRSTNPPRVIAEASRRIPCAPPPKCNADELAQQGGQQYQKSRFAESLASYEAAYACKPEPELLLKVIVIACNARNATKARRYWKRLSLAQRTRALGTCVRNNITETTLNAP